VTTVRVLRGNGDGDVAQIVLAGSADVDVGEVPARGGSRLSTGLCFSRGEYFRCSLILCWSQQGACGLGCLTYLRLFERWLQCSRNGVRLRTVPVEQAA
jgi:hypothetical protein